ncbi:hypothetical protein DYI95_002675 [Thermaerobacter sp. PB12/4term]|uniref:hypothetical protein n=1 Tax=Thermaerobacter sp. PB12/4term TaxID=2293838 RepID=UPI000E3289E5|nr:hypothetical protein [Thermaerobacter sp. PB12/4term]QIA26582.1 hypothetical protein DYI95_002675 [Thermaerobacter sp. PB12/4term]
MSTLRIPDHLRFWEPEADRLLIAFVQQALDEGGTVLDGCHRFAQALQASGPRVAPSPEQMAMRWEVLQAFGGDPARDPGVMVRRARPAPGRPRPGGALLLAQLADDLRRIAGELERIARRLDQAAAAGEGAGAAAAAAPPPSPVPPASSPPAGPARADEPGPSAGPTGAAGGSDPENGKPGHRPYPSPGNGTPPPGGWEPDSR